MSEMIGHNGGPSFDDVVRDNMDRGLLLSIKEVIVEAVRDPRLERRHLRVLAEVIACINSKTGTAYPGRKGLSENTRRHDPEDGSRTFGYTEAGIAKTLSELIAFGYLVSTKRAPDGGGRALAHYTIKRPSIEELQEQISQWIMAQRTAPRIHPRAADVTSGRNVRNHSVVVDTTTQNIGDEAGDVTSGRNVSHPDVTASSNVTALGNVTSDVTSGGATVTREKELGERDSSARAGSRGGYEPPNTGEVLRGDGVYVNGETIRHANFVIQLSSIRMGTINSGLSANETTDFCLAHALQWAAEIKAGIKPIREIIPNKVVNFLTHSIMSDVNSRRIQGVRVARASKPYGERNAVVASNETLRGVTSSEAKRKHWLENTEQGREMVRSLGKAKAADFFDEKVAPAMSSANAG